MTTRVYREESAETPETPEAKKAREAEEIRIGRMAAPHWEAMVRSQHGMQPLGRSKQGEAAIPAAAPPPPMPRPRPITPAGMPAGWTHPENGMGPLGKNGK